MLADTDSLEVGPDEFLAAAIVEAALGGAASVVRHRPTRRQRYVYDVVLTDGRRAFARIALPEGRETVRHIAHWVDRLRGLNVPLPQILARDLDSEFPYVVFERLPGRSLDQAIRRLPAPALGRLAGTAADIQTVLAALPSAGRYGFAAMPEGAAHTRWSEALWEWLRQSRRRIERADVLSADGIGRIEDRLPRLTERLDVRPAVQFAASRVLSDFRIAQDGQLTGLTDLGPFCWGDPRVAPALSMAELMNADHPTTFAEVWLLLAGGTADALFWLYAAIAAAHIMGDYGLAQHGAPHIVRKGDQARLDTMLELFLDRLDRASY